MSANNQFSLLRTRRFGPLFVTQFLGAFNDNVFRNALVTLITFQALNFSEEQSSALVNLCAALFILPFFLFSASAGQLADKYEKARLIRFIKILEIAVMTLACVGFFTGNVYLLIALLFFMGTQSTLFGPVKYGILPQHLDDRELIGGNGMIEMGTYLAILLGLIAGINLIGLENGPVIVSAAVFLIAFLGYLASRSIPPAEPEAPDLRFNWNLFTETWHIIKIAHSNHAVFQSILGISWFWALGLVYTTQLPNYAKFVLGGTEQLYMLLLTLFSIGIATGSLLCEKLSGRMVEIGLVPFGAIGLTFFGVDLFFASPGSAADPAAPGVGMDAFLASEGSWRICANFVLLGLFGGFFIVPLYALIQQRSAASHRSRVIAANNIINALMMVAATAVVIALLASGLSVTHVLLAFALFNAVVAVYIFTLVPEFLMRFLIWMLIHLVYRVEKKGLDHIPEKGSAVLVCNHVSFVDALIIGGCVRRPTRFVMDHNIFKLPVLNFIFRTAGAIPIASAKEDPELLEKSFQRVSEYLNDNEIVCIFPEGRITDDGEIHTFRTGIERIVKRDAVPVIPMALCGLWGSFFSRRYGRAMSKLPRRLWPKIALLAGPPVPPGQVTAADLQNRVAALRGSWQ